MSGRCLLDSNIIIALFAGENSVLAAANEAAEVFIPSIVIGELYYGAQKSGKRQANLARIDNFVAANVILVCDEETARWYGEIKQQLRVKGQPIPENDIWIAALARQHGLTLVTRDKHFDEIESLDIEAWQ
jgi:tRNA(fMet)-specific endonuclease VapC